MYSWQGYFYPPVIRLPSFSSHNECTEWPQSVQCISTTESQSDTFSVRWRQENLVLGLISKVSGLVLCVGSLETKVREDFTTREKAPSRAFFWLKAPNCASTFMNLLRHYIILCLTWEEWNQDAGAKNMGGLKNLYY